METNMAIVTLLLERFGDPALNEDDLLARLAWLRDAVAPRLERYLGYYRNPTTDLAAALPCPMGAPFRVRPFRQYQEIGLPARITGFRHAADGRCAALGDVDLQRKEVVIENDIAWRIDTLVDFAAGREPFITSTARDETLRPRLNALIAALLGMTAGAGDNRAVRLLQELVLQGAVCGSAWVRLRPTPALLTRLGAARDEAAPETPGSADPAAWLDLEVRDARRVLALRDYVVVLRDAPATAPAASSANGFLQRMRAWLNPSAAPQATPAAEEFSFDIFSPAWWQRYEHGTLVDEGPNPLGLVPLVRYQNAADPAAGTRVGPGGAGGGDAGLGDVEPLLGLQDELNTRLSDRAFRVTMSSFRMYLGKGIDDFIKRPVGPGQMWGTDNPDATIEAFGGDQATPSEEAHINEVREALDKISGVSPVAAGLIRGKLGNLTSAIALRLTLIALLARTERKRAALTQTLARIVRIALEILDRAGVVKTSPEDRGIDVNWPTPLPESDMDRLNEAQAKLALGVPRDIVLTELGYGELTGDRSKPASPAAAPPAADGAAGPS
jgi:hypothetical protein